MKKKILTGLILFFIGLFVSISGVTYAEAIESSPTGTVKITTDLKNNENTNLSDLNSITTRLAYIEDEAGKKYFCLDADKWYPYGNYYSASEILKNPVTSWLLKNYYHSKNIISDQNAETQYAVTQLAIWAKTNPDKYNDSPVIKNNQIILDLMAEADTHANDLSAEDIMKNANLSLNPLSQKFKLSEDRLNYVAQLSKVPNEFLAMADYTSEDSLVFTYNNQNITEHVKVNGDNLVKNITVEKQFFDSIYQKGVPLKIDLAATIKASLFVGVAYYTENSSFQPLGSVENLVLDKKLEAHAEVLLDKGAVQIKKIDKANKQPLANATFTLKDLAGNILETKTTDINGDIRFENLDFGNYIIEETVAPDGYNATNQIFNVTINEATPNLTYDLIVENDKKIEQLGNIKLTKLEDGTNKKLSGAEFALLDKDKKVIDKKTTDINGEIVFSKLAFGQYYIQETKAPNGFVIDATLHSVTVNNDTQNLVAEISLKNKKEVVQLGKIKLLKLEDGSNLPLKDAEFSLYDQNKQLIQTKVTSDKGEINFDKLPFGQYFLKETKAPSGFVLDDTLRSIIIDQQTPNLTFKITLKNKKEVTQLGKIKLIKLEDSSKKTLKDAEFTLFDHNKKKIKTDVTNGKGEINFDKLPLGQYYIQETKAPNGFVLDSTMHSVLIDKNTPEFLVTLTLSNKKEKTTVGSIEIIKRDKDTGKVLQGAEFALLNEKKEVLMTKVTDKNGKIIFSDLAFGKYFVKETKAPSGYELDGKLYEVDLSEKTPNLKHVLAIDNKLKPKTPITTIKKVVQKQLPKTGEEVFYQLYLSALGGLVVFYAMTFKKKF
ncbi:SpaA isopeptide-forming pilin-related protein [Vagococcus carniphilus]|uniref:SpaA isopeptide-forming pilin-related protein n=1 Tax=Vagococcus carniphilus TaxID=218144 RepID=UPI00289279BB|nr:SpaA isopeptide-forming pilin-related protein [Vagococcus carniphilus]MDT2829303.1 SpaA isopeptide-forming pilin-related protein [Vagococcus carniphilus]MDT2838762.1 SpaA isopeptide-forming pilin-related protein [Vagococcus carniphilus]MDT2852820.1 SpaA isopeptide-forming pilin-related protein [Vagococcus carniphilus]